MPTMMNDSDDPATDESTPPRLRLPPRRCITAWSKFRLRGRDFTAWPMRARDAVGGGTAVAGATWGATLGSESPNGSASTTGINVPFAGSDAAVDDESTAKSNKESSIGEAMQMTASGTFALNCGRINSFGILCSCEFQSSQKNQSDELAISLREDDLAFQMSLHSSR